MSKNHYLFLRNRKSRCDVQRVPCQRRLRFEALEERRLLSTDPFEWIGDYDDNWREGRNWHNDLDPPDDTQTARFSALAKRNPRLTEDTTVGGRPRRSSEGNPTGWLLR